MSGPDLQNYASANLLLAMLWFTSCCVWNPPFISKDSITVIEDDWTGNPHKMPVGLSVHEFYTPQLLRPESSFYIYELKGNWVY